MKLLEMNFSPCVDSHACEMSEDNLMDCIGFEHPNCGGMFMGARRNPMFVSGK